MLQSSNDNNAIERNNINAQITVNNNNHKIMTATYIKNVKISKQKHNSV